MNYYIDLLVPTSDLNVALDDLGRKVGGLYAEAWNTERRKLYSDKPFDLNINAFASMWFDGGMKIFVMYDSQSREPIGFLTGVSFRPMPYKAQVFQIQEWYIRGSDPIKEQAIFDHVTDAIRILGCDEVWVHSPAGRAVNLGQTWVHDGDFTSRRYVRR